VRSDFAGLLPVRFGVESGLVLAVKQKVRHDALRLRWHKDCFIRCRGAFVDANSSEFAAADDMPELQLGGERKCRCYSSRRMRASSNRSPGRRNSKSES
jgi:hypothetical protein